MSEDTQFSHAERHRALKANRDDIADAAFSIALDLSGQATGPFAKYLKCALEDAITTAVLIADLPIWSEWNARATEEAEWNDWELRREGRAA